VVGGTSKHGRASRTAITLYIKKEHKPSVLPIGLHMSVVELKYKPVWGWVFDSCNTHWFWVLKNQIPRTVIVEGISKNSKKCWAQRGGGEVGYLFFR